MISKRQAELDSHRKTYQVIFPSDLTEERVRAFLRAISGALHPVFFFSALPTIVFETWASDLGILHRIQVPSGSAAFIVSHLESLIPGIHVVEDTKRPSLQWTVVTEIGMTSPTRPLNIPNGADFAHSLLTTVQSLKAGEVVLKQWIIAPKQPESPPPANTHVQSNEHHVSRALLGRLEATNAELDDRRKKLETHNHLAIGRVAVVAKPQAADRLAKDVLTSMSVASTGANQLIGFEYRDAKAIARVNNASTPFRFRAQLSLNELSSIIAWPIGSPYIAGLPQSRTRHMHVNNTVPTRGEGKTVIGVSNVPGSERDIAIDHLERLKHVYVLGPIGSGKTSLLEVIAQSDMEQGLGLILIETKGDLFNALLSRIPPERWNDVVVWDLDESDFVVGFNVLDQSTNSSSVDELNSLLSKIYGANGVLTPLVMYHGLHALASAHQGTLIDLPTMLQPEGDNEKRWRADLIGNIQDRQIKKYWENYMSKKPDAQDKESEPLRRRIWQFGARPAIRYSLGQTTSSFQMDDVIREGKILLINLNSTRIGSEAASMMGSLIVSSVWNSVRTVKAPKQTTLILDEFQNFRAMSSDANEMLAMSRSFKLGMVLAHQNLGQITDRELREAVLANGRTKIVFQTLGSDARTMAGELGDKVKPDDLQNLASREVIVRASTATGVSPPFTMRTQQTGSPTSDPDTIRRISRAKYSRPIAEVEREIEERTKTQATKRDGSGKLNVGFKEMTTEQLEEWNK